MKKLVLISFIFFLFTNCEKEEKVNPIQKNPGQNLPIGEEEEKEKLPQLNIINVKEEGNKNWDYFIVSDKGDYMSLNILEEKPTEAFYHSEEGEFSVFMDENGLPKKVVSGDFIFLFSNFNGNKCDVGVIYPDKTTEIFREIESNEINWDNPSGRIGRAADLNSVLKWGGRVVRGIPCVLSVVATVSTGLAALPAAVKTCTSYVLNLMADIKEDKGIEDNFTKFVENYKFVDIVLDCTNFNEECFQTLLNFAYNEILKHLESTKLYDKIIGELEEALLNYPIADFVADKTSVFVGDTVYFTDLSKNTPNYWFWGFGDSNGALLDPNPRHVYKEEGVYDVALTVKNDYGNDTKVKHGYITVAENQLKEAVIQPGPEEGKDAWTKLMVGTDCRASFYGNGDDAIINMAFDVFEGCSSLEECMLIEFLLSKIPFNSEIVYAKLEVWGFAKTNYAGIAPEVKLNKLSGSWEESTVRRDNQPKAEFLSSVDFGEKDGYKWQEWNVTQTVQDWVKGEPNFGFLIYPKTSSTYGEIFSSDHQEINRRPKLTIKYYEN